MVLLGLEVGGERVDELLGHLDLALGHLRLVLVGHLVDRPRVDHLVVEDHGGHGHHVAGGPDRDEVLLLPDHHARDRDLVRLLHGAHQQAVGLGGAGAGREVIGVVEVDRVDLVQVHELLDLDRARLLGVQCLELLGLDHHVLVRADLVALDDVVVGHFLAIRGADALLLDAHVVAVVELVEAHRLARDRAVELHGHVDEPETDGTTPNRPRHLR